ncbi:predicted protein [Plenodomus lingam JN3]|uniref:Predicted protein n=1 Tax=Leptosphaeria maculans (strain JN3 / isolate v23.1.3 / race Av1-4-5-6-7-8) TaxID=985895 RepID=E4ZPT0_LEPMJ|nr:predicted protein [Plenodomus lingam JN3]CBX93465.1 predicted protein [Plenodomus lingam JN3]
MKTRQAVALQASYNRPRTGNFTGMPRDASFPPLSLDRAKPTPLLHPQPFEHTAISQQHLA